MNGKTVLVALLLAAIAIGGAAVYMMGSSGNSNTSDDNGVSEVIATGDGTGTTEKDDTSSSSGTEEITLDTGEDSSAVNTGDLQIACESGTAGAYTITESDGEVTVTFSGITEATSYSISGTLNGCIVIEAGSFDFELVLAGVTITSSKNVPISITGDENVEISAKKGTTNYIYDNRSAVSDEDISAAIHSDCDLKLKGKGKLVVVSASNNGIHSKDDLEVKNLTLYVTCADNALKGNDSVTITSGTIVLNATSGDGIKTSSTDLSSKGIQRGTVTVNTDDGDTTLTITAYCDGIDAAFDVAMAETSGALTVDITAGVNASASTTTASSTSGWFGMWGGRTGGNSWGQMGPDSSGNSNKADYSCKGIKAGNAVTITGGTISIDAFDDAIHVNSDDAMESGVTPAGDVTISGGTVTIVSKDDGIHADGTIAITGGTVTVSGSYEGLEGASIEITGGIVSLRSSDDGVNATSGGLTLSGGYLYVYAGGDGLDTNKSAIRFNGTNVVIISTSGGNSAIDADYSYTYTKGTVLAICPYGMIQEITGSSAFKSYGTMKTIGTLSSGGIVSASVGGTQTVAVKMPASMNNAVAFYIGSSSATITTGSSVSVSLDDNGVYFRS